MRILLLTHGRAWESGTFVRALSLGKALAALGQGAGIPLEPARRDSLRGLRGLGIRAGAAALHLVDQRR